MPNHVTNQIIFDKVYENTYLELLNNHISEKCIDFNTFIPIPNYVYQNSLSKYESEDFGELCGLDWKTKFWGTKWNAYSGTIIEESDQYIVQFDTAWNIPYPIIIAFANKFKIPFVHKYIDEMPNFWGIEEWKAGERINRRRDNQEDLDHLYIIIK